MTQPATNQTPSAARTPVVVVPGLACSARLFAPQIPELWRRGPVTIADTTAGDTIEAIAAAILTEAPPHFALAGLSMGGYIALAIMRAAPGRVRRLALLDTSARPEVPEATQRRLAGIALAEAGRLDDLTDFHWPPAVHPDRLGDAALKAAYHAMHEDVGLETYVRQQRAIIARADQRPHLPAIACPTLVLVGAEDALTPPEVAAEMADAIPGAELAVVPDCGHLSTMERPEAVNAALLRWLS